MKITIDDKYLDIIDSKGKQVQYFEHFEYEKKRRRMITICAEDKEGERFLKENDEKIMNASIYWYNKKTKYTKVLFAKGVRPEWNYLLLLK